MPVVDYSDKIHPIQRAMERMGIHLTVEELGEIGGRIADGRATLKVDLGERGALYQLRYKGMKLYPFMRGGFVCTFYTRKAMMRLKKSVEKHGIRS